MLSWWRERGSYNGKEKKSTTKGNFTSLPLLFLNRFGSKLLWRVLWRIAKTSQTESPTIFIPFWTPPANHVLILRDFFMFLCIHVRICVCMQVRIYTMLPKLLLNSTPVNRSLLEQILLFYSSFAWYAELFSWDCFLMFLSTSGCGFHLITLLVLWKVKDRFSSSNHQ